MPRNVLVVLLLTSVVLLPPTDVSAATRRELVRQCRVACADDITQCIADGGRRAKCKRSVLRRCKREGLTVCVPANVGAFHVATTGTDDPACGSPDLPCRTIHFVVDQLIPLGGTGTIKVAAGIYDDLHVCPAGIETDQSVVCILNKELTILGGFVPPNWDVPGSDPNATVLDGQSAGRAIRIVRTSYEAPMATLVLERFMLRNGFVEGKSTGDATRTFAFGAGLYANNAALVLKQVSFEDNEAHGGSTTQEEGGRGVGGGLAVNNVDWSAATATVDLQDVAFRRNTAQGGRGDDHGGYALGGALFTYYATLTGDGLVFDSNIATAGPTNGDGAGTADKSDALGGAMSIERYSVVELKNVELTGNRATGGNSPNGEAGAAFGGAVYGEAATITLQDAVMTGNLALGGDGKNVTTAGSLAEGGGMFTIGSGVTLDRVLIVGNESRSGNGEQYSGASGGGGLAMTPGGGGADVPFSITNCVVADNVVSVGSGQFVGGGGGGLFIQASTGTIAHTTIANNRIGHEYLFGAGLALLVIPGWTTSATITNSIFANHTSPSWDANAHNDAALYVSEGATADVEDALFANNRHDTNDGATGHWNLPPGSFDMSGIVHASDAGFVSAGSPDQDYRLLETSRAIDQGSDAGVTVDLQGNPRPAGRAPDLGAYELIP